MTFHGPATGECQACGRLVGVTLPKSVTALEAPPVCPLMAGLRPSCPAAATSTTRLHLGLLGNLQRIVDLDPEVSDRALEFAVTEQ